MQQELEALAKKHESLELDSKMRESELALALDVPKPLRPRPIRPSRRLRQ